MSGRWLVPLVKSASPACEIVCIPWAGGGVSGFKPFSRHLGNDASLWAVAPPGRDRRLAEPSEPDFARWLDAIGQEIGRLSGASLILFGHSFGAVLAFELAHKLAGTVSGGVRLLCVSSRRAPDQPSRSPQLAEAGQDELVSWIRSLGGAHEDILGNSEILELVLPPLREDLLLDRSYQTRVRAPLDVPILALGGSDDPLVQVAELDLWRCWTRAGFASHALPGGHFHLQQRPDRVLGLIRMALGNDLGRTLATCRSAEPGSVAERHRGDEYVQAG